MTDGELLEKAAKSIGLKYLKPAEGYGGEFGLIAGIETLRSITDRCGATTWNPLADDGDALRLAVKLKLTIDYVAETLDGTGHCAAVWCKPRRRYITEPFEDDPYAATRRAITLAAAELGEAKCD
jgi:hypothetical protein